MFPVLQKVKMNGPFRELNPGPLVPKTRIIPLDQTATAHCTWRRTKTVSSKHWSGDASLLSDQSMPSNLAWSCWVSVSMSNSIVCVHVFNFIFKSGLLHFVFQMPFGRNYFSLNEVCRLGPSIWFLWGMRTQSSAEIYMYIPTICSGLLLQFL